MPSSNVTFNIPIAAADGAGYPIRHHFYSSTRQSSPHAALRHMHLPRSGKVWRNPVALQFDSSAAKSKPKSKLIPMRRVRVKVAEEYSMLESMLTPLTRTPAVGTYAASLRRLREVHRPMRSRPRVAELAPRRPPKPDEKMLHLISSRNLTGKDIDSWIQINVISSAYPFEVMQKVDAALDQMIEHAGPTALWGLMQYLAKYWEVGVMGERPMIRTARRHAELVLLRALKVCHETTFGHGTSDQVAELVGVPQIDKFDRFVASLFEYLQIERQSTQGTLDKLDDLLFRLHARCGPIAETQNRAKAFADQGLFVSGHSSQELLSTLSRWFDVERDAAAINVAEFRHKVRLDLEPLQDMLSADITPGSMRFMLVWLESTEELWSLLAVADQNDQAERIYAECQVDLVRTIERLGLAQPTVMAQATGLVARISEKTRLTTEFYECWLLACAKAGNVAAVSSTLAKLTSPSDQVLSELLDAFPLVNHRGKDSLRLIEQIRPQVPESLRHKWILALHRAGGDMESEWARISHIKSDLLSRSDVLLALFASVPASSPASREILEFALLSEFRTHIIEYMRAHELMDAVDLNRAVAKFVMMHPELNDHEIDAMLPDLENAHHVVREQEAELIWPL